MLVCILAKGRLNNTNAVPHLETLAMSKKSKANVLWIKGIVIQIAFRDMSVQKTTSHSMYVVDIYALLECPLYHELRKKTYIRPYYWKRLNMPNFIELLKTENKIEIRNLFIFITLSFDIRKKHFILSSMPLMLSFFIYVVDLLICNCIYNEGRWFVDISLYLCILNIYNYRYIYIYIYMFVYCLFTERHFCLL